MDHFKERDEYELIAGYFSPVADAYRKDGLAEAKDRVKMCELAVESTSDWLMVDSWESRQERYQRTAVVLDHFNQELNDDRLDPESNETIPGGITTSTGIHNDKDDKYND